MGTQSRKRHKIKWRKETEKKAQKHKTIQDTGHNAPKGAGDFACAQWKVKGNNKKGGKRAQKCTKGHRIGDKTTAKRLQVKGGNGRRRMTGIRMQARTWSPALFSLQISREWWDAGTDAAQNGESS